MDDASGLQSAYEGFDPELIEHLRRAHAATPLHQVLGLRFVDAEPGLVVVEMPVAPGAFNASGNLHGGAIATLVDVAAGSMAARSSSFRPGENNLIAVADFSAMLVPRREPLPQSQGDARMPDL